MAFKISSITRGFKSGFTWACTRMAREGGCIRKIMERLRMVQPEVAKGMLEVIVGLESGRCMHSRYECTKTKPKIHSAVQVWIHESNLDALKAMLAATNTPCNSGGCAECSSCIGCDRLSMYVYSGYACRGCNHATPAPSAAKQCHLMA